MDQSAEETSDDLERLAGSYKAVVALIGLQLCVTGVPMLLALVGGELLLPVAAILLVLRPVVLFFTVLTLPIFAYRVFDALGASLKLIWALLAIIPLINLFVLGWMSRKATTKCEELGVPVGLFGPKI